MNINEIDFEDELEPSSVYEEPELDPEEQDPEGDDDSEEDIEPDDLIGRLLQHKGIKPEAVKIANDKGEIEEKQFDDLTVDEQLLILNYDDSEDNYGLEADEVDLINFMRNNRMDVNSYKNYIANEAIKNYTAAQQKETPQTFEVDSYSDDELFVADLKARIPDLTQEEAVLELEAAHANEAFFQRRMEGLRKLYKEREEAILQQEESERQLAAQKQAEEYERVIIDALQRNDTIDLGDSSITFSEDDMDEIASFILDTDLAGVRHIAKALNDPKTLIGMAWYAMHGQETFSQVADYYKSKITEAAKYNYNKGYLDAASGKKPNSNKKTTVRPPKSSKPKVLTINDLD